MDRLIVTNTGLINIPIKVSSNRPWIRCVRPIIIAPVSGSLLATIARYGWSEAHVQG